jgi:hypothetical protein
MQRRYAFRNERHLYKNNCSFSGKTIVSAYSPDKGRPVYENGIWWSDKWDARTYGQEYDFGRPFFGQMKELLNRTPLVNLLNATSENSEYTHNATYNKNCYMLFCGSFNEDCLHSYWIQNSISCIDCSSVRRSESCYECNECFQCYDLLFARNCSNCTSSQHLAFCMNCTNCVGCVKLRNASYRWLNQQLTKEEYDARLAKLVQSPAEQAKVIKAFEVLLLSEPQPWSHQRLTENCTGNYIYESQNCRTCFNTRQAQDCAYCQFVADTKECMDTTFFGLPGELLYECNNLGIGAYHCLFTNWGYGTKECIHCYNCHFCDSCFACVSLHHQKYCILNKQYTKAEYEELVPRIIEHMRSTKEWGEFPPASISPFGYNETVAQEYFPLTKNEAEEQGFVWSDYTMPEPHVDRVIAAEKLPISIEEIPDDILNWAIECEATKKPYRIVHAELEFYRRKKLPVPRLHPDERHRRRMSLRNPRKLWNRICAKCKAPIVTSYGPERPEIVYCEKCYLASVY